MKTRKVRWKKILIIYMALGFRSPCPLSSCSFWRALSQSAAWSDPAEPGFSASRTAAGHYRAPAPHTPRFPRAPRVTPRDRSSLGAQVRPRPCRHRLKLALPVQLRWAAFAELLSQNRAYQPRFKPTVSRHLDCHLWPLTWPEARHGGGAGSSL